jgi:hypothetical protein
MEMRTLDLVHDDVRAVGSTNVILDEDETPYVPYRGALDGRQRQIIEQSIAQVFGVPPVDLCRTTRGRAQVALARQVAMYIDHITCGHTFTEVGGLFARDRTTVAYACNVIEDRRDNPSFDRALELLEWAVPSLLRPRIELASSAISGTPACVTSDPRL